MKFLSGDEASGEASDHGFAGLPRNSSKWISV